MPLARFALLAGAVGCGVALACTWPLVLHVRTSFLDDGSYDAFQFAWNLWWVGEALLDLHRHPFATHHLFYPDGVPLLFHTGSFTLGLLTLPLQPLLGVVGTANLVVLTAPALTCLAIALLARELTDDPWAAILAAVLGTVTPMAIWVLPVMYLSCGWVVPGLLWGWWQLQRSRRWWGVALFVVTVIGTVFVSQEYAMMAVAVLGLDAVARLAFGKRLGIPPLWVAGSLTAALLTGAVLGGLAALALAMPAQPPPAGQTHLGSGYLLGLLTPPWIARPPLPFWTVFYLGTMALPLAVLGVATQPRRAAYAMVLVLPVLAMTLGPYVHLEHPFFSMPPEGSEVPPTGIPGPWLLAGMLFPLLRFLRAPYRWMTPLNALLALPAALGLAWLRARVRAGAPRAGLTVALTALAVVAMRADVQGLRAPLVPATIPAAYRVVAADPTPAALLDLPSGLLGFAAIPSRYMFFQTAHGKYLLDGTVSRLPVGRTLVSGRIIRDFSRMPWLKWVVIHHDLLRQLPPGADGQTRLLIDAAQRQGRLVASDDAIDVYELDTFRPETVWSPKTRRLVDVPPAPRALP